MKKLLLVFIVLFITCNIAAAAEKIGVWKNMPISVYIEDNRNAYLMKRSFGDWQSASNKLVSFTYTNNEDDADIVVKFIDKVSDKAENAVGLTYPYVNNKGYFVHAKIEIAKYSDFQKIKMSNYELVKIMRHEIGHAIGLEHTNFPNSIMNPVTTQCLNITKDDLKLLKQIYNQ